MAANIAGGEIKKVSMYLDNETSLLNAINKFLNDPANASATANTTYAFMYKNDTYLLQDQDGSNNDLSAHNDTLVKLAGYHIDNLNPYVSGAEITM